MKIAVTSQNFRTITGHAGKARRFLVFDLDQQGGGGEVDRIDLPMGMAFHDFKGDGPHPIDRVEVVVTAGCGDAFFERMERRGIRVVATAANDPLSAAQAVARGEVLPPAAPHEH